MNRGRHKKYNSKDQYKIDRILYAYGYKIINNYSNVRRIIQMAIKYVKDYRKKMYKEIISTEFAIITFIRNPYIAFDAHFTKEGLCMWIEYFRIITNSVMFSRNNWTDNQGIRIQW